MNCKTLIVVLLSLILLPFKELKAQWEYDSITLVEIATPTLLVASGATFHYNNCLNQKQTTLRDQLQSSKSRLPMIEDGLQYLPALSVVGLSALGLESKNNPKDIIVRMAESYIGGFILVETTKRMTHIRRPDNTSYNSFMSGHTFTAFVGAEMLRREYGENYPLIAFSGYTLATATGFLRMLHNRHWLGDVLSGAGLGIVMPTIVYWINDATNTQRLKPINGGLAYTF